MGICSSANATPPSIVDLEGEVEAGAEDNVSGTSKPTNTREAEEEEFGDNLDLEDLGVEGNTLDKLSQLNDEQVVKELTSCMLSHFADNDTLNAHDLGKMLGLKSTILSDETATKTAAPLFVQRLHQALRRIVATDGPESDMSERSATMGITDTVEAFLHVHGHANDINKQSTFLYDNVYCRQAKGNTEDAAASEIKLLDTEEMAASILESAVDLQEFQHEIDTLGLFTVEGDIEPDVKKIMIEHLKEELGGNNDIVSREKFALWVKKCNGAYVETDAERNETEG